MRRNKKTFILLIGIVITVFLAGTITATYAWFLSRYSRMYDFVLGSDSPVILKYETDLSFRSGDIDTPANILVPATAKRTVGIEQQALSPLDMFDADTVNPAHTGKVRAAAQAVAFTASGAYWTGEANTVGEFSIEIKAFLASYATAQSITSETIATHGDDARELTQRGELGYIVIFAYLGYDMLYYDGTYYLNTTETAGAVDAFDFLALDGEHHWHAVQAHDTVSYDDGSGSQEVEIYDGAHLLLQPNCTFDFDLYAFVAKTDEELDPEINGKEITVFATIMIQ